MTNVNKPLLVSLTLALLSLTAYQAVMVVNGSKSQVLGETTSRPYPTEYPKTMVTQAPIQNLGGIPCGTLRMLEQQYCSTTSTTNIPVPTARLTTPTKSPQPSRVPTYRLPPNPVKDQL